MYLSKCVCLHQILINISLMKYTKELPSNKNVPQRGDSLNLP